MANNKTITSANAIFALSITPLFPSPIQLQGFSADDIFTTDPLASAETLMGLDGRLSAGFVFVPVKQHISFMADSDSIAIFEQWWGAQQVNKDIYFAQGIVTLLGVNKKWALTRGVLDSFAPIPDAAKTLRAQRHGITWESVSPAEVI